MERVLIIEDDELIAELERDYLEANGYETALAFDGITGEQKAKTEKYDAILLDVMLPGKTGFDVCRELRKSLRLPIIMVTAKKEDIDKIRGLGLGADDYLVKPFHIPELSARIRALTRRPTVISEKSSLQYHDLSLSLGRKELSCSENTIPLTPKEFLLMCAFLEKPDTILTREQLMQKVWETDAPIEQGNVDNYVYFLRKRLRTLNSGCSITASYGSGYLLEVCHDKKP